ncbi:hypothetical protein TREES_T100014511 [Tupaia chinensis]|uniref:DUF4550 domain-containing protein n=1 Tax=Tupaia chinensis TaxID=246437 RepID=L8Y1R0_TUPCH|nr:hypothetical protein TREES_T100014511 [Tupaia chinensis]
MEHPRVPGSGGGHGSQTGTGREQGGFLSRACPWELRVMAFIFLQVGTLQRAICSMSLHSWEWEYEDRASVDPMSSFTSFYQSLSEHEAEEHKAKAEAQGSDSDRQCSSTESWDEHTSTANSDVPQLVPCKFIISLAFPTLAGHKGKYTSFIEKYRKRPKTDSVAKVRRFYHIEYTLLPDDEEPKIVDMVLFPSVAKVFLESGVKRLCMPVYCRYQFHTTPVHQTEGQPHGAHVHFQDINVIFLGAMHPSELQQYLEGPPMEVEVHDRDRKSEDYSRKPTLFGEDPLDSFLNLQALISPKETETNPFESQDKMWDPHGVAQVSLADLLLGYKYLNLTVPIHSCEPRPTGHGQDSRSRKVVGFRAPPDGLQHGPMPMGHYLEANSMLKLRVDIAVPLRPGVRTPDPDLLRSQFGRIVFVFDSKKLFLLHSLLHDITMVNARALDLDSYPIEDVQQILSAFKMRVKVQEQQHLDVLTGFHLLDGRLHLFVLEGLAGKGLQRLWERHQNRIPRSTHGMYKVLYNSQLLFQHRLYADLEPILYHVHLFQPVAHLARRAALYVRLSGQRGAFQALARIHDLCYDSTRLREVIVRDLLPTSAMIRDLSQEFGMPISQEELTDKKLLAMPPQLAPNLEDFRSRNSTLTSEIHAHQEKYLRWRNSTMLKNKGQKGSLVQGWKENKLFANELESVLDRGRWSWDRRHLDFDLYKQPPPFFTLPASPALKPETGEKRPWPS